MIVVYLFKVVKWTRKKYYTVRYILTEAILYYTTFEKLTWRRTCTLENDRENSYWKKWLSWSLYTEGIFVPYIFLQYLCLCCCCHVFESSVHWQISLTKVPCVHLMISLYKTTVKIYRMENVHDNLLWMAVHIETGINVFPSEYL
jgi:hypothetical protein